MATIYLATGGKIELHKNFVLSQNDNGNISLRSPGDNSIYLGTVLQNGTVILVNDCYHTYYPPEINKLEVAVALVKENLKHIGPCDLAELKQELSAYNIKTKTFKP